MNIDEIIKKAEGTKMTDKERFIHNVREELDNIEDKMALDKSHDPAMLFFTGDRGVLAYISSLGKADLIFHLFDTMSLHERMAVLMTLIKVSKDKGES